MLTPHEAARVQTFPDFTISKSLRSEQIFTLIGNAVPPLMAKHINQIVELVVNANRGLRPLMGTQNDYEKSW